MSNMTKVSIQMRETGEIVREDIVDVSEVQGHLMYLDYYWGIDDEAWVDRKNMWVQFSLPNYRGRADIHLIPVDSPISNS